jgi:hypothetical protein
MRVTSFLFAGLFVVTGGILSSSQANANGQCHKINTTITSLADFSTFTTQGEIKSGFLKGTTEFIGDPLSLTLITITPSPPVVPFTSSYTGDLTITTRKGTLTTRGVGIFEPGPFGLGTQFDRVISGTGLFDGADGYLFFNFETDDTGAVFTGSVSGEVCVK